MLSQDMERYVALQRAGGLNFQTQYDYLKRFVAFAEAAGDDVIHADRAIAWASLAHTPKGRRTRLGIVRRFALAMRDEDARYEVPSADLFGTRFFARQLPHIYTSDEITRLMQAAMQLGPPGSIRPLTYVTLFGLLAVTGLRISEALSLKIGDVTADGLVVRESKFRKSRLVPLHPTTRRAIDAYLSERLARSGTDDTLFVSTNGRRLIYQTFHEVFLTLARSLGLRGEPYQKGPRVHDLRHTFAVRSLEQCGTDRRSLSRHMVALSTYMGHVSPSHTYWYLQATPALMKQIAEAGETLQWGEPS